MSARLLIPREAAVRHESGHVAGLHALGISVHSVDVEDRGDRHGFVAHDLKVVDRGGALKQAKHTMCAFIAEGAIPAWPLDQHAVTSTDEKQLAHIGQTLGWDEDDYHTLIDDSHQLMLTHRFREAYNAIHDALQSTPRLDEHALQRLLPPAEPERKTFATRWVTPQSSSDRMGWQILADRDAAIRRARTAQTARRHNSPEYKRARAATLALLDAERAKRERQRTAHDLYLLTRSGVA